MAEAEPAVTRAKRSYHQGTPGSSQRELREIYNLELKTTPELKDMLRREKWILKAEGLVDKLPDKGAKVKAKVEAIQKEIMVKELDEAYEKGPGRASKEPVVDYAKRMELIRQFELEYMKRSPIFLLEQGIKERPDAEAKMQEFMAGLSLDPPEQKTALKNRYDEALMTPSLENPPIKNMDSSESLKHSVFAMKTLKESGMKLVCTLGLPPNMDKSPESVVDRVRLGQFFAKLMHPGIDEEDDTDSESDISEESDEDEVE